jgi:predicted RNA binding protein YcfA (HicA-like mRNA interferase family)
MERKSSERSRLYFLHTTDYNSLNMSNIPVLKPQEIVKILEHIGFIEVRQKGAHNSVTQMGHYYRETQKTPPFSGERFFN